MPLSNASGLFRLHCKLLSYDLDDVNVQLLSFLSSIFWKLTNWQKEKYSVGYVANFWFRHMYSSALLQNRTSNHVFETERILDEPIEQVA